MTIFGDAAGLIKKGINWGSNAVSDAGDWVGDRAHDFAHAGDNRYQNQTYNPGQLSYGGQYGADNLAQAGLDRMNVAGSGQAQARQQSQYAAGQMQKLRGPQAIENQDLSDRESLARYGDQNGSIQLAREAAMGMAPSQAAYQMQAGLDRSLANQQAMQGSARGAAGIALASGNAAANTANLQNQAFNEASQLRANEMAQGRAQYGQLSSQQRDQDLQRLNMGNQMGQFNANLNDQYRMGMGQLGVGYGGLANQYGQQGLGWYQASQNPYDRQAQMDLGREQLAADSFNQGESRKAGVQQALADQRSRAQSNWFGLGGTAVNTVGQMIPTGGSGGPGKKP